ncbi:MAG: Ldh family oxidoreductase [Candidatus Lokiarchaeota archaeon]
MVIAGRVGKEHILHKDHLRSFIEDIFINLNVPNDDARIITDVILTASLKGIDSHGIQRIYMYYDRIKKGIYNPKTEITIVKEGPTTAVIDGNCGMGHVVGYKAMELAIKKAKKYGIGAVAVRNSSHFGIAGYYTEMASKEGMIGIATTNASPLVPPTNSVEPMLGTNPLSASAPTDEEFPFLLDCATSMIQKGTVEMFKREDKTLPTGATINDSGEYINDPNEVLDDLCHQKGGLLPMGSDKGLNSSHKGYGYGTLVEILSSGLQDGVFLKRTGGILEDGKIKLKVGHFFLAINIENFIPLNSFKHNVGEMMRELRSAKKAPNKDRIYTAGEIEHEKCLERKKEGIPVNISILRELKTIQEELGMNEYEFLFENLF